jgi:hypothetical protein
MNYDYIEAGFDGFLSRSIDDVSQTNLDSSGPVSTAQAFDRTQVTGQLGDTLQIGKVKIDGVKGRVSITDDSNNEVARFGELDD